jgi:hypothetical protein
MRLLLLRMRLMEWTIYFMGMNFDIHIASPSTHNGSNYHFRRRPMLIPVSEP